MDDRDFFNYPNGDEDSCTLGDVSQEVTQIPGTSTSFNSNCDLVESESDEESVLESSSIYSKRELNRTRTTNLWICTVQLMDIKIPGKFQNGNDQPRYLKDEEVSRVDQYLKQFVEEYFNKEGYRMRHNKSVILWMAGAKFVYHPKERHVIGLVIMRGAEKSHTLSLNSHLRVEKLLPLTPLVFKDHHKVYFGSSYPIHIEDEVCKQGNSLRPLLNNWVDNDFTNSLHWIIPPVDEMELILTRLLTYIDNMQAVLEQSGRKSLREKPIIMATPEKKKGRVGKPRKSSLKELSSNNHKIYEYLKYSGEPVRIYAYIWEDGIPHTQEGYPDMKAYDRAKYYQNKKIPYDGVSTCDKNV